MAGNNIFQTKKLLLIDQRDQTGKELEKQLNGEYDIFQLKDCSAGMEYLTENGASVHAVLLSKDHTRADKDSFLQYMSNNTRLSTIPVLLLMEDEDPAREDCQFETGVVDCIEKPFKREIIKNRIENAVKLKDSLTYLGIEKMLKELPSNIYLKDSEGRYVFATHYWHHLEHKDDPDWTIRGKTDPEIRKDKENAIAAQKKDLEILSTGRGSAYTIEINEDGMQEFYEIIKQPTFDDDGNISGIIGLINNVTDHELLKMKLEARARTDELTGVYNRTYFDEYLQNLLKKNRYPISIVSADCDGLKRLNDTYGHLVGDDYIRMTVLLFKMAMPEESALFRTGGDEFILILPSTSKDQANQLVDQMRGRAPSFQIRDQQLSVSFGVSCLESSIQSVEESLAESDRNMYSDKRQKKAAIKQ